MYSAEQVFMCFDTDSPSNGINFDEFSFVGTSLISGEFAGKMEECTRDPTPEEIFEECDSNSD
jgi:hypothetical protein